MKSKTKRSLFIFFMLLYPVAHFLVFFVFINFRTIQMCFEKFDYTTGKTVFSGLYWFRWAIENITDSQRVVPTVIINSLLFIPVTVGILLPISIITAYIFSKKIPFVKIFRTIYFLPAVMSIVVMTMSFAFMLDDQFGVVNKLLHSMGLSGLARVWLGDRQTALPMVFLYCIWVGIGYNIVLLSGAICRIPEDVIEYGQLEGLSMPRELCQVVIPMIWPTVSTLVVLGSMSAFTIFLQPKLLTEGGPGHASRTMAQYIVEYVQSGGYNEAAVFGVMSTIAGFLVVMLVRYFMDKFATVVEY